ncbi:MAG: EpsI family protein [Candidatus Eisenbacteria bacterium]|nr:EpsI family protein [Candidatus Latescibacterota bacterium]MBD3301739.1 EpsI family protein [Candidatus Eisenbacteria bacterium]
MLRRRGPILFVPGLLVLLACYRLLVPPAPGAASRLESLPMSLLDLPGEKVPLDQAVLDELDSDDLVIRRYLRPDGVPIWVVLVYFVNTRLGGHDPQLCYRSQGYRTRELSPLAMESALGDLTAERFEAGRPGRTERVATFWYTPGGRPVSDVRKYRFRLFLQGLRENRQYGVFVRVSTLEAGRPERAEEWNRAFVAELARQLPHLIAD